MYISTPWLDTPPQDYGGTELVAGLLADGLARLGHRVHLFCRNSKLDLDVHRTPVLCPSEPNKYSEHLFLKYCAEKLRGLSSDLLHTHVESFALYHALLGMDRPLVLTLHIPVTPAIRAFLADFKYLHCVVPSRAQQEALRGAAPRVHHIAHGIQMEEYHFSDAKEPYLLYLGRVSAAKGADLAVELARAIDLPLVMAGPVYEQDLGFFYKLVSPYLTDGRVTHIGPVGFREKTRLLAGATALLNTVRGEEAFGLNMVEAAASGTPVLGLGRGAVGEVVADGQSGVVAGTFPELLERWPEIWSITPAVCRQWAQKMFDRSIMVRNYLNLYQELVRK